MPRPNLAPLRRLANGDAPSLASVTTQTRKLPNRVLLYAGEGWGKTSFAAQAPKPIFLMTRGEDGLLMLIDNGIVPPIPHFPECMNTWHDLKTCLHKLIVKPHDFKTLVVDTLNGAERLCHEHFVEKQCNGEWEKFDAYGRGPKQSVAVLIELTMLQSLLTVLLREQHGHLFKNKTRIRRKSPD